MYFCSAESHFVTVREDTGRLVRKLSFRSDVTSAQMSGENVVIQTADGFTYLYAIDGRLIRKVRS